ncbi:MAG: hypothetical protein ACLPYS_19145 [Vulcanimicrobiaceae bacterium]
MQQRLFLPVLALTMLAVAACPLGGLAADFGKSADVSAVRTSEEALLRTEVPPVQRDVVAVTVSNVIVAGNYAVCSYSIGESAGYSVFSRAASQKWKRISHSGDAPTKQSLRKLGVPASSIDVIAAHGGV